MRAFSTAKGTSGRVRTAPLRGEGAAGLLGAGCSPGGSFLGGGRGWGAWAALPSSASSSITKDTRSSTSFKITPELVKLQKQFCRVRAVFLKSLHSPMFPEPVEGRAGAGSECLAGTAFPFGKVEASWRWRVVMEVPCECASRLQRRAEMRSRWPTSIVRVYTHTERLLLTSVTCSRAKGH